MEYKNVYIGIVTLLMLISVYITTIVTLQNKDGYCPPCPENMTSDKGDILLDKNDNGVTCSGKYAIYPNSLRNNKTGEIISPPIRANYPDFIYEYENVQGTKCCLETAYYAFYDGNDIRSDGGHLNFYEYRNSALCRSLTEVWKCENGSAIVIDSQHQPIDKGVK